MKIPQISLILSILLLVAVLASCSSSVKPLTAEELLDLGERYLLELNYEEAVVQFTKLIEVEAKNPRGYLGAAEAYVGLKQIDNAIAVLEKGLVKLPDNTDIRDMFNSLTDMSHDELKLSDSSEVIASFVFNPETAFSIDGIELGVTDLSIVKSKYSARSDYKSNLMNDNADDTVYSMPYMDDDDPDNDMWFGYLFVQPVNANVITQILIRDSSFVYMDKYRIGEDASDFAEGDNEFSDGNKRVIVSCVDGIITKISFELVGESQTAAEAAVSETTDTERSENVLISNIKWDIQSVNPSLSWIVPDDNSMIESYQVYYKPCDSPENTEWIKSPHNGYWRPSNGYTYGRISVSGIAGASHIDGFLSEGKYIFKVVAVTTAESGAVGFEVICPVPLTITRTAVPITINNLVYDASLRQLEVHGKFPENAQMLYIQLYDGEQNSYNGWIKKAATDKGIVEIREGLSESDIVGKRLMIVYATGSGTPDAPIVNIAPSIDSNRITVIKK